MMSTSIQFTELRFTIALIKQSLINVNKQNEVFKVILILLSVAVQLSK